MISCLKTVVLTFTLTLAGLLTSPAHATVLTPGSSSFLIDTVSPSTTSVLLASIQAPITVGETIGFLTTAVYSNPDNPFCASCLDFYFQLSMNGVLDPVVGVETWSFAGWQTNVATVRDGASLEGGLFEDGIVGPTGADRSADGSMIGFRFAVPVLLGLPSQVFMIQTDAVNYGYGTTRVIDDPDIALIETFAPTAVPEPGTLSMLAIAAVLVGAGRRFRRS